MKQQQLIAFLKYPYSALVLALIWVGSAVMIYQDRDLPVIAMVLINLFVSWFIAWQSYKPSKLK